MANLPSSASHYSENATILPMLLATPPQSLGAKKALSHRPKLSCWMLESGCLSLVIPFTEQQRAIGAAKAKAV